MASISCGHQAAVNIYFLKQKPDCTPVPRARVMVALRSLEDLAELVADLKSKGIEPENLDSDNVPPEGTGRTMMGLVEDKPWGYRQFDLVDIDGNMIVFFAFLHD